MELLISEPALHKGQQWIIDNSKRFNVICNGRRWGKTVMAVWLAEQTILNGGSVGYFVPTFDFGEEFWEEMKERLEAIIDYKSESKMIMRFKTGGSLKIWSLEKERAGRGRKYNRVIVDEAAFGKNLKESWEKAIRATLTDLIGDAWFLSTPQGNQNYFRTLYDNAEDKKKFGNWASFQMPSSTNPHLSPTELEEIKMQLDDLTWLQEFEAQFVDFSGRPFLYSFDKKKTVGQSRDPKLPKYIGPPKKSLPLVLSFDFNVDPITCTVWQHTEDKKWIRGYREIKLENSNIYSLCDRIKVLYGTDYFLRITGDASGHNRSAMVPDNLNYYKIIKDELGLPLNRFFVPSVNPGIKNNRIVCNSILQRHPDCLMDEAMVETINDFQYVETDEKGEIMKDRSSKYKKADLLDTARYYFNSFHSDFIKIKL